MTFGSMGALFNGGGERSPRPGACVKPGYELVWLIQREEGGVGQSSLEEPGSEGGDWTGVG